MLHVSFFWKYDLILFITFPKKSNHLKKTKFGQGLIPQTLIQRFGMLKDFQLSKWELNLGVKGLLPFYSHKVSCWRKSRIICTRLLNVIRIVPSIIFMWSGTLSTNQLLWNPFWIGQFIGHCANLHIWFCNSCQISTLWLPCLWPTG
jgi:hypothetical protein